MSDNEIDEATMTQMREQAIKIDRDASSQKMTVSDNFMRIKLPARIQSMKTK